MRPLEATQSADLALLSCPFFFGFYFREMNSWKPNYCFNPTGETAEAEARVVFHVATSEDE